MPTQQDVENARWLVAAIRDGMKKGDKFFNRAGIELKTIENVLVTFRNEGEVHLEVAGDQVGVKRYTSRIESFAHAKKLDIN